MSDWRFYLATLHVTMLSVSRANAVEVSLTPTDMSWYFGFLETYVFPFILAASVALLIGYGIMRVFEKPPKDDDLYARIGPAHDPELPVIDVPDEAPDAEEDAEPGLTQDGQAELSRALRSAVESASSVSAPTDSNSLLERISARATEQERTGRTLDLESLGGDAPVLENTDELVHRISARVTEQVMGLADEISGMPSDNAEAANKLDALLQRIGARSTEEAVTTDAADAPAESTDSAGESGTGDDDLTPAERLDALLARINAPAPGDGAPTVESVTPEPDSTGTTEAPHPDRLDSIIERIGARAAGGTVEDVEVAAVAPSSPADDTPSPSDKLDVLMRRIRGVAPQADDVEPATKDMAEPAAASGEESSAIEPMEAETAEDATSDEIEPLSPTISDEDLPDLGLEIDTAMDDSYTRRVEPTFAPEEELEQPLADEAAFDEFAESQSDIPLEAVDIASRGPGESVEDMTLDVENTTVDEDTDFATASDEPAAVMAPETQPGVSRVIAAEMSADEAGEAAPEPEADSTLEQEADILEETAAGAEIDEAPEESPAAQSEAVNVESKAGGLASADKVDELVKRIGARVPEEPEAMPEGASRAKAELVGRISARVPEEAGEAHAEPAEASGLEEEPPYEADIKDTQGEDEDMGAPEEEVVVEKPILERLVDRDRQQDEEAQAAQDAAVPDEVAFPPDGLLVDREDVAREVEPLPEPVVASLNGSDDLDAPPIVETETVREPEPPAVEFPMPAADKVATSGAATELLGRIVSELETASSALDRVSGIVEGFETAREGLDLEALGGLRIGGIGLPHDTEAALQQLGDDISGAAGTGFAAVEKFNHIIDQLSEMAQDEPLDEGWNELLQDRVQETIAVVAGASGQMRDIVSGEARAGDRGYRESGRERDNPSSAGVPVGGE